MYDLLNLIKPYMTSVEYETIFTLLQTRTLTTATKATSAETIQATAVKQVANALLGNIDTTIANFSFDGDNAGKIILSSRFDDIDVAWDYSLDGGKTWTLTEEHELQLTDEEIAAITAETDIKVHIMGVDYSEENIFTIDIQDSLGLPSTLYANDLENKLIDATSSMQWKYKDEDEWTSYSVEEPDLTGNKTIIVRTGATGVYLAESKNTTYNFTEDNQLDTQKYIPIEHLSIHQVSSEQTGNNGHAVHAIDGNINTIWHTAYDGSDSDRTIIIKLDEPVYLSALQYVPRQSGSNGIAKNATLYVSMDGENWTEVDSATNWANNASAKMLELDESIQAQYVKFVTTENWGDGRNFASASMINLFEDTTKKVNPTAEIEYDITEATNKDVTVKLVNPSTSITITNNDGSNIYTFTENGQFTFEFIDQYGNTGTATAIVDWISKESEDDKEPDEEIKEPEEDDKELDEEIKEPEEDDKESDEEIKEPEEDDKEPDEEIKYPEENIENPDNNENNITIEKDGSTFSGKLPNTGINDSIIIKATMISVAIALLGLIILIEKKIK